MFYWMCGGTSTCTCAISMCQIKYYLTIRFWAQDVYHMIRDEGTAQVDY